MSSEWIDHTRRLRFSTPICQWCGECVGSTPWTGLFVSLYTGCGFYNPISVTLLSPMLTRCWVSLFLVIGVVAMAWDVDRVVLDSHSLQVALLYCRLGRSVHSSEYIFYCAIICMVMAGTICYKCSRVQKCIQLHRSSYRLSIWLPQSPCLLWFSE